MLAKVREYINRHENKQILSVILILVILAVLPITVIVSQQQQEIRQRASEVVSPPSPPFPHLTPVHSPTPHASSGFCNACSADVHRDGRVDYTDLTFLRPCFNKPASYLTGAFTCANRDINKDRKIDIVDMNCVTRNIGKVCRQ